MKIVCGNCSAKYSIADDKVAGRAFKIRCRKCSATIVVRGSEVTTHGANEGAGLDAADDGLACWHVVVDGEQAGPFDEATLKQMLTASKLSWNDYAWKEDFDDWKVLKDIPDLVARLSSPTPASAPAAAAVGAGQPAASLAPQSAAASQMMASGASMVAGEGSASLRRASAPSEGAASDSRPSMPSNLTGQRNESSVLFSLANLQALAGAGNQPGMGTAEPKADTTTAKAGGSGLIDIRSLAGAARYSSTVGDANGRHQAIDDLLAIGGSNLASPLAAPVLKATEEPKKASSLPVALMVTLAVALAVLAAALVFVVVRTPGILGGATASTADEASAEDGKNADSESVDLEKTERTADDDNPNDDSAEAKAAENDSNDNDSESAAASDAQRAARKDAAARTARRSASSRSRASRSSSPPSTQPIRTPRKSRDLDSLLSGAVGGKSSAPDLPDTPSRKQVFDALKAVQPAVKACGRGEHGTATAAITVNGGSGRVTNVSVSGPFRGTPQEPCIERAVKRAKFPRFKRSSFRVSFPYVI